MAESNQGYSRSVEDYLKAIYEIAREGGSVSTNAISRAMGVQPASVTGMVKRLHEAGLLEHVPYHGVQLTPAGRTAALRVLRRHRIIETYLCERLGYTWADVHEEAERLEHAVSDRLVERMETALSFPRHDPHGAPIPTLTGDVEAAVDATLADAGPGALVRVRAVRDRDPDALRGLERHGLLPGIRLEVARLQEESGHITVEVFRRDGPTTEVVARELAEGVFVVPSAAGDEG